MRAVSCGGEALAPAPGDPSPADTSPGDGAGDDWVAEGDDAERASAGVGVEVEPVDPPHPLARSATASAVHTVERIGPPDVRPPRADATAASAAGRDEPPPPGVGDVVHQRGAMPFVRRTEKKPVFPSVYQTCLRSRSHAGADMACAPSRPGFTPGARGLLK